MAAATSQTQCCYTTKFLKIGSDNNSLKLGTREAKQLETDFSTSSENVYHHRRRVLMNNPRLCP